MPEYPGGMSALMKYLSSNIKYPEVCRTSLIEGKVFLKFIVNQNGNLEYIEVIKSSGVSLLDDEAVRVVKTLESWKPGMQQGRAVNVYFNLPINFKIGSGPSIEFNANNQSQVYLDAKERLLKGDKFGAKGILQKAVGDVDAWYVLGVLAYDAGDKTTAKHYFENVINNISNKEDRFYKRADSYLKNYFG